MTLRIGQFNFGRRCTRAFTLIELILVMALLTILTSIAAPSLSRFFRGRELTNEARQLLSLAHAGQSRAVAGGFPVLLWIDSKQRAYGLQEEGTLQNGAAQDADPKAEAFGFGDHVQIDALNGTSVAVNGVSLPAIRFLPDGSADENSPTQIRLTAEDGGMLWLLAATNHLSYEINNSDR